MLHLKKISKNQWLISVGSGLSVLLIGYYIWGIGKPAPIINNEASVSGSIQTIDQTGGTNLIIHTGNSHEIPISGVVNGINQTYIWSIAPTTIVVDGGRVIQRISSDGTINWTGVTTTVLTIAPNFDVFGQY